MRGSSCPAATIKSMYPETYQNKEDGTTVYWFSSPFDPLNNWSAHVVVVDGLTFHTVEHAYRYHKFIPKYTKIAKEIRRSPSPWAAMQQVLTKTGDRKIVENSPWDSFWGAGLDGKGMNTMGQLWMRLRDAK